MFYSVYVQENDTIGTLWLSHRTENKRKIEEKPNNSNEILQVTFTYLIQEKQFSFLIINISALSFFYNNTYINFIK